MCRFCPSSLLCLTLYCPGVARLGLNGLDAKLLGKMRQSSLRSASHSIIKTTSQDFQFPHLMFKSQCNEIRIREGHAGE